MFWFFILQFLKLDRFQYRHLTQGEIALCQGVFANLIDYSKVLVMNHPYLPWQPKYMFMAPQGYIHVRHINYKLDFSRENLSYQAIFIHEMAHIYQHQQNIPVLLKGAFLQTAYFLSLQRYNPYKYTLKTGKKFFDYNIEQQGDIARDIFLNKIPNIIVNSN